MEKRRFVRATPDEDTVVVSVFPGTPYEKQIPYLDLSVGGVGLKATSSIASIGGIGSKTSRATPFLKLGDEVRLGIKLPLHNSFLVQAKVVHFDERRVGLQFINLQLHHLEQISRFLLEYRFPNHVLRGKVPFGDVWRLFKASGYLDEKPFGSIDLLKHDADRSWRKLNRENYDLSYDIVAKRDKELVGTGSVLRVYSNTWMMHQLAAVKNQRLRYETARDIYFHTVSFQMDNSNHKYLLAYYNADWNWHRRVFDKFAEEYGNREDVDIARWVHFEVPTKGGALPKEVVFSSGSNFEPPVKGKLFAEAMDYEFGTEKISLLYRRYGLQRERQIFCIDKKKDTIAELHCERATSGLNLFNLLNQFRVRLLFNTEEAMNMSVASGAAWYHRQGINQVSLLATEEQAELVSPDIATRICSLNQIVISKRSLPAFYQHLERSLRLPGTKRLVDLKPKKTTEKQEIKIILPEKRELQEKEVQNEEEEPQQEEGSKGKEETQIEQ
ncbi:PilZ domain-containing protein [Bdellovibrionota bacterium]